MTRGSRLVCVASLLLAFTLVLRANDRPAPQYAAAAQPGADSGSEYLGSASCAKCHDAEHTQWKNSIHIKMSRPVAEATIRPGEHEGTDILRDPSRRWRNW